MNTVSYSIIPEFDVAKVAAHKHADRADLPVPAAAICRAQVLRLLRLECFAGTVPLKCPVEDQKAVSGNEQKDKPWKQVEDRQKVGKYYVYMCI